MKLFGLSLKNATVRWWRSLTLGFLLFAVSFVLVISNSLILSMKEKTDRAISSGITGDVQIRSNGSSEGDMVTQYSPGWDALKPVRSGTVQIVGNVLKEDKTQNPKFTLMVRQSAFLTQDNKREETMLIGISQDMSGYKDAFLLKEGRYLEPADTASIMLTEEQANSFGVGIGDSVHVSAKNRYGLNTDADYKVVGIGNFVMLSLFSYKACYLPAESVRELIGLDPGDATDIILYLNNGADPEKAAGEISARLHTNPSDPRILETYKKGADYFLKGLQFLSVPVEVVATMPSRIRLGL